MLNAKVNMLFYFFSIGVAFYSRKIFLEYLGADFLGLTGTLGSILQYLNIAELGVGTAIAFNLYKPLHDKDYEKMTEIMSLFKFLYKKIGVYIAIVAVLISLFFPIIFSNTGFEYALIYYAFFSLLFSSLVGYFVNYRTILLSADQKEYHLTKYTETTRIVTILIQMFLLYKTRNLYLYLSINILLTIVNSYIINLKLDKEYPWLKTSASNGKKLKSTYPNIFKSVKQVFIHKIKDTVIHHSDQLFIFAFESLKMIAYYGNYTLVATRVMQLFISTLNSFGAGVGNLISEGDKDKIYKVFWELMAIRYFITGIIVYAMYHLLTPFIILWLGEEYLLANNILILILVHVFISQTRGVVDMYNNAYGLYGDVWAAWTELGINLSVTLIAGYYLGLEGILIGKVLSIFIIIVLWKPLYLFNNGLKLSIYSYWKGTIKYYLVFVIAILISNYVKNFITVDPSLNF
ncbi:sugar transporter, partial [bacterium]|nr:sugar transporter [bacterium]